MRLDPAQFLCLMAVGLVLMAILARLLFGRPQPYADINPRTGERTDVHR